MSLSFNNIVDVTVNVSNPLSLTSNFNLGCIIGTSNADLAGKVTIYSASSYAADMVTDGFATTDPEYIKAQKYFSQNPKPSRLAVAEYDSSDSDTSTPAKAFGVLRAVDETWYAFCFAGALSDAEIEGVAAAVEASAIPTMFFYKSSSTNCVTADTTNILKTLKTAGYTRSFGFYSEDANIDIAMVGLVSGLNTMAYNSAYTVAFKSLAGITAQAITDSELAILQGYNGNVYANYGNAYSFVYSGISGAGFHVDEIYAMDAAKFLIQTRMVSGLIQARKIPQSESGIARLVSFAFNACEELYNIGLIDTGVWSDNPVLGLQTGDTIDKGFYIEAESLASQTATERATRVSPPIHIALLLSGAVEKVVVNVYIER